MLAQRGGYVCNGVVQQLSVTATGTSLTYQWQSLSGSTWSNIAGATSTNYTPPAQNGTYRVVVSNSCGSVTSLSATETVSAAQPATITSQPPSVQACSGASTTLTVGSTGTSLSYQWEKSTDQSFWTTVGTAASVTVAPTATTYYRVWVSNVCRTVLSTVATVTIVSPITLTTQPAGGSACGSWTMTAATSASGVSYQWQSLSGSWTNIAGATSSSYSATASGTYRCLLTNTCGQVASSSAAVTITPKPAAPSITGDSSIRAGDPAYLRIANQACPGCYNYFWSNGVFGPDNTVVYPTVTTSYQVQVFVNGCWSNWSAPFTVTVVP